MRSTVLGTAARVRLVALVALVGAVGCGAGDGSGLDEDGHVVDKPWAPPLGSRYGEAVFDPTFSGVSEGFFRPFCSECHAGSSAPRGLDLAGPEAWEHLVGRASVGRPGLKLVEPGNPGRSYLIVKLEGGVGMSGQQMPRGRPARPQSEIDLIAAWIQAGALKD